MIKQKMKVQKINIPICCDDEYSLDIERLEKKLKNLKVK